MQIGCNIISDTVLCEVTTGETTADETNNRDNGVIKTSLQGNAIHLVTTEGEKIEQGTGVGDERVDVEQSQTDVKNNTIVDAVLSTLLKFNGQDTYEAMMKKIGSQMEDEPTVNVEHVQRKLF